jgi:hypothetical protein
VFGNPPFIGKDYQTKEQKADSDYVMHEVKNYGLLDYVSNWFVKAANYIQSNSSISVGFVSTNSITQGEQVSLLWAYLLKLGVKINYAYRTFKWNNEGRGNAAVHCVITGWSLKDKHPKLLVDYKEDINGEGTRSYVENINPYLVNAANIVLTSVRVPIVQVPIIVNGSKPTDGGNLLLSEDEKDILILKCPSSSKYIRKFLDADSFINNINRYCLWLDKVLPDELKLMPEVYSRVQAVRKMRAESNKLQTQELASVPYLFAEIRQPNCDYLAVPKVSSERRDYVPFAMVDKDTIIGDRLSYIPNANLSHFAVMTSSLHMSWMRAVCGRMKSDYNYSNKIVYNNFPWQLIGEDAVLKLIKSAQAILDARNFYPNASLADLYDPLTMPVELVKAHDANNKAVDKAYGYTGADDDASRVAFLFKRYEELTSILPPTLVKKKQVKKVNSTQTNLL